VEGWESAFVRGDHRVHTERQLPISGVHSITMEKSAQAGEGGRGGGSCPTHVPPFTLLTITYKVVVYAPAERADALVPISSPYPYMYSVGVTVNICRL
jgi:hypothetical protein